MWLLVSNKQAIWLNTALQALHLCVLSNWLWKREDCHMQLCHTVQMFAVLCGACDLQTFSAPCVWTLNLCWKCYSGSFCATLAYQMLRELCVQLQSTLCLLLIKTSVENVSLRQQFTLSSFQLTLKHSLQNVDQSVQSHFQPVSRKQEMAFRG